jgi:hypothetical protein
MNKKLIAGFLMLGSSVGMANASIVSTSSVNATHITSGGPGTPNSIETYYIQANSTGNVDIFMQSQVASAAVTAAAGWPNAGEYAMDGVLSIWKLSTAGDIWTLIGANDNAARISPFTTTTVYGTTVNQADSSAGSGFADPGLTLNLTSGNKYMILQSEVGNGPTSLPLLSSLNTGNYAADFTGALGQTTAVASNYRSALKGGVDLGIGSAYSFSNSYTLYLNGNASFTAAPVAAVPVPGAVWLFGSALAGFTALGRKKTKSNLVA